jgi:hypothetical protein
VAKSVKKSRPFARKTAEERRFQALDSYFSRFSPRGLFFGYFFAGQKSNLKKNLLRTKKSNL